MTDNFEAVSAAVRSVLNRIGDVPNTVSVETEVKQDPTGEYKVYAVRRKGGAGEPTPCAVFGFTRERLAQITPTEIAAMLVGGLHAFEATIDAG